MNKLIALGYHSVGTLSGHLSVPVALFKSQMEYLRENGYSFLKFNDIYNLLENGKNLPRKPVLVFFDDGYRDIYLNVYPILKKLNIPATMFPVTNFIDGESAPKWTTIDEAKKNKLFLSWDEIMEMRDLFEIGSHTISHRKLGKLTDAEALYELENSKKRLKDLTGYDPISVSFPHSSINSKTDLIARKAGYRITVSMGRGYNYYPIKYFLKKIPIGPGDNMKIFKRKLVLYPVINLYNKLRNLAGTISL